MQFTHAFARAVTASALTAIVTVGAVGPVHADKGKGTDRSAAAQSAAADRKAGSAEKDSNKGQRTNADKPAKAQGGKSESKSAKPAKAQGGKSEGKSAKPAKAQGGKSEGKSAKPGTRASKQNPRGYGHTPVTVCHLRGNGTYIEITFDENALDAHKNHGDLYPVPAGGCPATADEAGVDEDAGVDEEAGVDEDAGVDEESDLEQPAVPGADDAPGAGVTTDTEVAGVDAEAGAVQNEVLGVQAEADAAAEADATTAAGTSGATGAPANAAAGILPNTGAGQFGLALLAGLGLLAAGAAVLARRRPQMSR